MKLSWMRAPYIVAELWMGFLLQLHSNDMEFGGADIRERVWCQRRRPPRHPRCNGRNCAAIEDDDAISIAAHKVAPADDIQGAWPTVCMQRSYVARCNACIEDAHGVILEEQLVMLRCRGERVQGVWWFLLVLQFVVLDPIQMFSVRVTPAKDAAGPSFSQRSRLLISRF